MTLALAILGGVPALAALVLFCPVVLRIEGRDDFKMTLFLFGIPSDAKKLFRRREKSAPKEAEKPRQDTGKQKKKTSVLRTASDLLSFLRAVFRAVRAAAEELGRHLKIRVKHLSLTVATEDAARTALCYGEIRGALGALFAFCEEACDFRADYERILVEADFEKTAFTADICISLSCPLVFLLTGYARVTQAYYAELFDDLPLPTGQTKTKRKDK